ncbi:MAG: hypothetical protein M1818_003955 [Claussenomyces sp. TS43310]|nr:MAG: hypothetical protein M1818_003955 [Claussenomyces sp. TS43310]
MSRSTDPGHFFQTDASEATRARRAAKSGNKNGNPTVLKSKILAVIADPYSSDCVYVAESAGCIRNVNIETKATKTFYVGPAAPVTSVAIGGSTGNTIFAGCWDKDIWSWEKDSKAMGKRFKGHADFVKTIICARISGKSCLISGGADKKIMVWDVATGERLHTLRDKSDTMLAVQYLAIDPVETTNDELALMSSSSDSHIRRWRISLTSASQADDLPESSMQVHETSIYTLLFDTDDEANLWTASADGSVKCLSRARKWATEETIEHGDYVRTVALTSDWIITAGRSEDVKVWDRATGKLFHIYEGHYEEVTGLVVIYGGKQVVSVSIDGTVRVWPLDRSGLEKARIEKEEEDKGVMKDAVPHQKESLMTAEEEAELAELMDDSDEA